jgi:Domain of unknown function (DUF4157)
MEARFQESFADVRLHLGSAADASAQDVNARAYTVGPDIVFARGEFAPVSPAGRRLIVAAGGSAGFCGILAVRRGHGCAKSGGMIVSRLDCR